MAISGQKVVTTAGVAVPLGSGVCNANLMIKALVSNTGLVFVGNVGGDVAFGNGQELDAGEHLVLKDVPNFGTIFLDADINGDGVSWIMLNV
jgi:hypothetical protein